MIKCTIKEKAIVLQSAKKNNSIVLNYKIMFLIKMFAKKAKLNPGDKIFFVYKKNRLSYLSLKRRNIYVKLFYKIKLHIYNIFKKSIDFLRKKDVY